MSAKVEAREHGTRARYVGGPDEHDAPGAPCHCAACTKANRDWAAHRNRMKLYGRWQPFVDAGPAREHVRLLGECGIGVKRVAALAGLPVSVLCNLMYGKTGRPPTRRLRPQSEDAILAVLPSRDNLGGKAIVDATATLRRLRALVAIGWSQAKLSARLGLSPSNFGDVLARSQVTAATERAVLALYDELWDKQPPETTHREKISVSRARSYAAARGWALPQQWDDDEIGDPAAVPAERRTDGRYRRGADLAAEAAELAGYGLDRRQVAERLGVSVNTLNIALSRAARKDGQEDAA